MRILFLTHSFNSLAQRLWLELTALGHEVSIEFDIHDDVTREAVRLFEPDLIVAPFLKRALPELVWRFVPCLVVHPGPPGDRGPSSLDWAILEGAPRWGVTVLQASEVMDGGDVWASETFDMRLAPKSSIYRREVTEAAVKAVLAAVARFEAGEHPQPQREGVARPVMRQASRAVDWARDDTLTVLRKIHCADGSPGLKDDLGHLYGAHEERSLRGTPGAIIAQRYGAICRATVDGAVWISHIKRNGLKLPAARVLATDVPHVEDADWQDIRYEEHGQVGFLDFDFYNGAMDPDQCERLTRAWLAACRRPTRVIVLMGGQDFWSNGIHLHHIEAADSPADESWRNIQAMDDLTRAILTTDSHVTVAALQGNAGAGGCFLALAADQVVARRSVVLNPHYQGMGNLYGSEYWTYLLPRRVGSEMAERIRARRMPMGAGQAARIGLIDACLEGDAFREQVAKLAQALAERPDYEIMLEEKRRVRAADEAVRPLSAYREDELAQMRLNFYGFDPSYHVARYHFVYRVPHAWTPLHLAVHRRLPAPDRVPVGG